MPSPVTPTRAVCRGSRRLWPKPPTCSNNQSLPARHSATKFSTTTSTTPGESWPRSGRRSQTGSGGVALNDSDLDDSMPEVTTPAPGATPTPLPPTPTPPAPGATPPPVPGTPTAPLIGGTTYLEQTQTGVWDVPASFLPKVYLDGVTDCGGIAILLPPQPVTAHIARSVLAALDGLIITGGADVDPARYGQSPHERTSAPRTDRDEWEQQLIAAALEAHLPLLGLCRGIQLLNVTLGGTLIQHLPDTVGTEAYQPGAGQFGRVPVTIKPDSTLASILHGSEPDITVPVYHHQAVDTLAHDLRVTAVSADGVIEAVECTGVNFAIGVQWHPEEDQSDRRIFRELIRAGRGYPAAREHLCTPPHPTGTSA